MTKKTGCSGPELLASPLSPTGESGTNPGRQDGLLRASQGNDRHVGVTWGDCRVFSEIIHSLKSYFPK